ncbi:sugar porter family MFS transporter [Bifidobacterium sp. B4107]|uniref:sugar porter family MFS transporter n=1 Tax=unclassified Bifidobacterium TaxID=2608897 RepID=UPI00226B7F66|nr:MULTISPECIES: sugar porter family MFS transporter [unclassified Bifidobacterium]MCX8647580.1 sugar porter family MFS transporter [Bifidobacterium sp. B4107]MCX8651760.1 sugar porter family MFS transporter [Bifidobacterium sp. B4111]MCX8658604.1 sugar porter family MFS transporter [Bifidobacterium sp. B4114]
MAPRETKASTTTLQERRRNLQLMVSLGVLAGGLYGYTLTVISGTLVGMNLGSGPDGHLTAGEQGMVTSALLIGAALGSYLAGRLNDRLGPRLIILTGALLAIPGALLSALAPSLPLLELGRLVIGVGIGMTSTIVPIYLADMVGTVERGRVVSVNSVMIVVWQLLAVSVNAIMNRMGADWRTMLWAVVPPAVLLALLACFLHDSPAHLIRRGEQDQAAAFLEATRDEKEARETMQELSQPKSATTASFKAPWLRRVLIVGIGVAMINQLTGLNIVNYYAPTIFTDTLGFDPSLSMVATVPVILVSAIAATIGGLGLIDRFDRRAILAAGLAGTIVFLAAIGVCYRFVGAPGSESRTAAWIMIGMMMIYVVFVQGLVAPVTWLLLSEIFPQEVKSRGMGYANVAMNLTNFGLSLVFPTLLARLGGTGAYLLFALINVCALVFAWVMVPETRGKSLAQIEQEARARA